MTHLPKEAAQILWCGMWRRAAIARPPVIQVCQQGQPVGKQAGTFSPRGSLMSLEPLLIWKGLVYLLWWVT